MSLFRSLIITIPIVLCLVFIASEDVRATKQLSRIRVGVFDNYPVVFVDDENEVRGIYVELLDHIASKEGWEIEYVFGSWQDNIARIQRNELDLLTSIGYTADREQFMRFSKEKVLTLWGQVFYGEDTRIEDIFDLENQKVAVLKDGINGINFRKLAKAFDIQYTVVEADSYEEAVRLVETGQAGACILNNVVGTNLKKFHNIHESPVVFAPFKLLFASPRNVRHDFLDVIDGYMKQWKSENDSFYYKVLQHWYGGAETVRFAIPRWLKYVLAIGIPCLLFSLLWVIVLHLQIEKRKKTEKALSDSENRFRCLSDAAFEGVVITEKGTILEANDTFCDMFGYRPNEVVGKDIIPFITSSEQENVRDKILSGYEQPYETSALKRDGSEIPIEIRGRMLEYREKQVRVAAIRDLSERKRAEKERENLISHLQATLDEVQTLRGILPICSYCKHVRNDEGYYEQIEAYIYKRSGVDFSHTICPECLKKHYPETYRKMTE